MRFFCYIFSFALCLLYATPWIVIAETSTSPHFRITGTLTTPGALSATNDAFSLDAIGATIAPSVETFTPSFAITSDTDTAISAPPSPRLSNDGTYYDRLHFTLAKDSFPVDTQYAVMISSDFWKTWQYVHPQNHTTDKILTRDFFASRDTWGNLDGILILGLSPETPYTVRVAALPAYGSASIFGPPSETAQTDAPLLRMRITQTTTDIPFARNRDVIHATQTDIHITTNTSAGYQTFIRGTGNGTEGGLYDPVHQKLIPSDDLILGPGTPGYGAQATSSHAHIADRYAGIGAQVGRIAPINTPLSSSTRAVSDDVTSVSLSVAIDSSIPPGYYTDTITYTVAPHL